MFLYHSATYLCYVLIYNCIKVLFACNDTPAEYKLLAVTVTWLSMSMHRVTYL